MERFSLLVAALPLAVAAAGCSVTAVPIHGTDGKPYVYVDCSSVFRSLEDCYAEANRVCPGGYRLVNGVAPRSSPFGNLVLECASPQLAAASDSGAR
ncbi:MAG: hypothetical protein FJ148_14230 [Deltaproteobacteria bacterium]|nr:hypothetical protein [Deltaproteobacteria bacterium]